MKLLHASTRLAILMLGMVACTCAAEDVAKPSVPVEAQEAANILSKAPFVLILSTAQYYLDAKKWPTEFRDISRVVTANEKVLPPSFIYQKVTFSPRSKKECAIDFAFEWPTLEGGGAQGTIIVRSGGSLKDMAKASTLVWRTPPKLRADLIPDTPPAPPPPAPPGK